MSPLLNPLPLRHPLLPSLQMRKLLNIHPGPSSRSNPPPVRDIRNRRMPADEVPGLRRRQVLVEHAVEPARFVDVAVDTVGDVFGGVAREVVRLALHGAHAGVHEVEPVVGLVVLAGALRVGDFVGGVVLLDEVLQDAAGFEEADFLAVWEGVCYGGDAAVGVDFEEPAVVC